MARCQGRFLRNGSNSYLWRQEVVDDLADLGLGEAVLGGEVVNGGVDPPFSFLGPRLPRHRLGLLRFPSWWRREGSEP